MLRTQLSHLKTAARLSSLRTTSSSRLLPLVVRNQNQLQKLSRRSYSARSVQQPSKSSNFGILLVLSALAGGAGYLFAISSSPSTSSSTSSLPISTSPDSRYTYSRDLSPPNLPHVYGSKQDFSRAIAEIKGYFSATSGGEPGDQFDDYVTEDDIELRRHGYDEIGHDSDLKQPHCVVFARSTEDVVKIVGVANKYRIPVVPFSGGTSLEGHFTCPYGGISLDVSNMNQIKELHAEDGDMVVGAGARWEDINDWLSEQGHDLFFPLDPGPAATVGGMISTGCSGTNAVRYGTARNGVILNLTAVLPSGEVVTTRSRARKSSAGPDLTSLFTGAEGTLGVIVEATIRLYPKLPISVGYCSFPSVELACSAVRDIVMAGAPLQCIELLDSNMLKATNKAGISTKKYDEKDSLFIKLSGSEASMDDAAKTINKIVQKYGSKKLEFAKSQREMDELWNARRNALWSAKGMVESGRVWTTDSCVPLSSLPRFIKFAQEEIQSSGLETCIVSHCGDGNVHCFLGLNDEKDVEKAKVSVSKLAEKAIEMGGTCTGEHSIGNGKKQYLQSELGDGTLRLLKALKLQIDPLNLFNPGKLYPEKIDKAH